MTHSAEVPERALGGFLRLWAFGGAATVLLSVATIVGEGTLALGRLALVSAVVAGGLLVRVALRVEHRAVSINLAELGVVVGIALLEPAVLVLAVPIGSAIADLISRAPLDRLVFNVSVCAVGAAGAGLVVAAIPWPVSGTTGEGIAVITAGLLAYGAVNLLAAVMLLQRLGLPDGPDVVRVTLSGALVALVLSGSLGILVVTAIEAAPAALPAVIAPVWMVHRVLAEHVRRLREQTLEHHRLERTVEGARDGIALLDAQGAVALANPALARWLDVAPAELVGKTLLDRFGAAGRALAAQARELTPQDAQRTGDVELDEQIISVVVTALFDRLGVRTGWVILLIDVTEQRESDSLRRELVARVSHELRTPLTAIQGFAVTLLEHGDELSNEEQRRYLGIIRRQAERLGRLVSTLLWSARLERAHAEPVRVPVPLGEVVEEVLATLEPLSERGSLQVTIDPVVALVDPDHLHQVLTNLVVNALTYGAPPVCVEARQVAGEVHLVVSDAGPGVPPGFVDQLFVAFAQVSRGDRRVASGLGLGLSIAHELLTANGGHITYRRRAGRTCFEVVLAAADDEAVSEV